MLGSHISKLVLSQEVPSEAGAMQASIQGLETLGGSYRSLAQSLLHSVPSPPPPPVPSPPPPPVLRGGLARLAGPSMARCVEIESVSQAQNTKALPCWNHLKVQIHDPILASSSSMLGAHRPPSPLTGLEYSQVQLSTKVSVASFCTNFDCCPIQSGRHGSLRPLPAQREPQGGSEAKSWSTFCL